MELVYRFASSENTSSSLGSDETPRPPYLSFPQATLFRDPSTNYIITLHSPATIKLPLGQVIARTSEKLGEIAKLLDHRSLSNPSTTYYQFSIAINVYPNDKIIKRVANCPERSHDERALQLARSADASGPGGPAPPRVLPRVGLSLLPLVSSIRRRVLGH